MLTATLPACPARLAHGAALRALAGFHNVPRPVREELAQETALRTWRTLEVSDPAKFAARVARRLAIDWIRRAREVPQAFVDAEEPVTWERRMDARLDLGRAAHLIARAPGAHRATLIDLFLEDRTIDEVVQRSAPRTEADRCRERDALYKRRKRALAWMASEIALRRGPQRDAGGM